jgi:amidase
MPDGVDTGGPALRSEAIALARGSAMLLAEDPVRAFMPYPPVPVTSAETGPLAGLTVGIKDLYDVAGYRTGCGSPVKLAEASVATAHAPVVAALLSAGARFVGKTHTDELAWSLYGMNAHFGTPKNPRAPDRVPGGSSSGSAAAVAAGLCDIGLGSDTGGSVRAPASFCGIYGIRTTHGRVKLAGAMALAPTYDTAGWFARDGATLARITAALCGPDPVPLPEKPRLLIPVDMLALLPAASRAVIEPAIARLVAAAGGGATEVKVYDRPAGDIYTAFRKLQSADVLSVHGDWFARFDPPLSPGVSDRFRYAKSLTAAEIAEAATVRASHRAHLHALLGTDGVLVAPAVHDAAPKLAFTPQQFDDWRHAAMTLLCVAGNAGLPQAVAPAGLVDGAPIGVSLIGPAGSDTTLAALLARIA